MIRRSKIEDSEAIKNIWRVCFKDREEYIDFFLRSGYDPSKCFVYEIDGSPVSMLHLRYGDFVTEENSVPALYIYAAATLPEYQGRGIMRDLISTAGSFAENSGFAFTFLLPASESLYGYYERLGFRTAFEINKVEFDRQSLEKISEAPLPPQTDLNLSDARKAFFRSAVHWRREELNYAFEEWKFTGGKILEAAGGYVLARENNGIAEVKEICGNFSKLSAILLSNCHSERFSFLLPPDRNYPFQTKTVKYGMLKSVNSEIFGQINKNKPYVNLMLD